MKKKNTFGFTLIELLTVIMIIGILASVILVSMDTARKRAADTTIQNQIGQLRSLAEALYTFENHYEDFISVSSGTLGTDDDDRFARVENEINRISEGVLNLEYSTDFREYCMHAPLVRESGDYCVDSTGDATVVTDDGSYCESNFRCRAGGTGGGGGGGGSGGCDVGECGAQYCLNPPNGTCVECINDSHCDVGMGEECIGNQCI